MPFSHAPAPTQFDALTSAYLTDETNLAQRLVAVADLKPTDRDTIRADAHALAIGLREDAQSPAIIDAFLQEFTLSSEEGVLLMRLAESLIRTPDTSTATTLLRDKLLAGDWRAHFGARHPIVKLGTAGLAFARVWIARTGGVNANHLLARLGDRVMLAAVRQAIGILGRHFVLGTSIENALKRGAAHAKKGATYSYDMLGEAAITAGDAERYFNAYKHALQHLASRTPTGTALHDAPALSVKLSALHPRYEYAKRGTCVPALVAKLLDLCDLAKAANLGLTIDAEEAERLEVSLLVFEQLIASERTYGWNGLGLAIQAYQRRALAVIDHVHSLARANNRMITVRLVKGAYWDSEIKRAQELGLESYPVFTRKEHTDISYIACARRLLECGDQIYPQFATHNAHTAAAILHMAGDRRNLELQRLHGMSDGLHRRLSDQYGLRGRTYAPVGRHKELLPYLVRRLLENGANNSFVNQILDSDIPEEDLISDPIELATKHGFTPHPRIHAPRDHFDGRRLAASGLDLSQSGFASQIEACERPADLQGFGLVAGACSEGRVREITSPIREHDRIGVVRESLTTDIEAAIHASGVSPWSETSSAERAQILRKAADLLEQEKPRLMALCIAEAGKTWQDADAEVREAVDFLRYYANQSERPSVATLDPLGTIACISPWNFPLAIFLGQVSAALAAGNTVIAKPAEQTPLIAFEATKLLHQAGVPTDALHVLLGDGKIGAELTAHPNIHGVCFTGSTNTAKRIARTLANTGRGTIPLIAETGGINAMIVDSTALLEQAVKDVVESAFQSAGQRCSACRIVCVQDDIADAFKTMLSGAVAELKTGDPALLDVDLGPVIDADAQTRIHQHIADLRRRFEVIAEGPASDVSSGTFVAPIAFELNALQELSEEIFGPVLHVVQFRAADLPGLIEQINAQGFGLTMGLHTRIDARIHAVATQANVGNLYVNRNQIGAVVGRPTVWRTWPVGNRPQSWRAELSGPALQNSAGTASGHAASQHIIAWPDRRG